MTMYQPVWAHRAFGLGVFTIALWVICYSVSVINRRRRADDPIAIRKNRANLRWATAVYFAVLGQLVVENYSQAYDVPHQTSLRARIIIGFEILGPALLGLQLWFNRTDEEQEPPEQDKPYYRHD